MLSNGGDLEQLDQTYQRQGVTQKDEPRRVIWEFVGKLGHVVEDFIAILRDFLSLLVDLIFNELVLSPVVTQRVHMDHQAAGWIRRRTYYSLRILGSRCS